MYPKFFTPNGDGFNDSWKIKFSDLEVGLSIQYSIDMVNSLKLTQNNSWDGMLNGHELPTTDVVCCNKIEWKNIEVILV
jgi:gliding motility-associated-like protein